MKKVKLTIFDETLRDGEQQVGIFFDTEIKHALVDSIVGTGVHHLALMPAIHHTEAQLVKNTIARGHQKTIVASTMMGRKYIDEAIECGVNTIILFNAASDRLMYLRDAEYRDRPFQENIPLETINPIRNRVLEKIVANFKYAKSQGLKICFAAEDASRADFDFLVECMTKFTPYIEHFILCDTVGILTPEDTKLWIRNLIDFTGNTVPITVHFHNDRGLALENTIQAILAGATGISGTFGGIGERAGNVAIEQVINSLKLRYGWEIMGINYDAIPEVIHYLNKQGFQANSPYSPASLYYETGIHVESLLRDRNSYYLFDTGYPEIWYGKFSGASNFKYLFEKQLNLSLTSEQYQQLRQEIKHLAIQQKRSFSAQEVIKLPTIQTYIGNGIIEEN